MAVDDFDRADDPDLGSNWVSITDMAPMDIFTNEARVGVLGDLCAERYAADTPPDDQESFVNLGTAIDDTVDHGAGPAWRMSASEATCYYAYANTNASGHFQYAKRVAGVTTQLGAYTGGAAPTTGQGLAGRSEGDRQSIWVDDVEVAFTTDASIASGNCGIMGNGFSVNSTVDNWRGGSLVEEEQEPSLTWLVPIAVE